MDWKYRTKQSYIRELEALRQRNPADGRLQKCVDKIKEVLDRLPKDLVETGRIGIEKNKDSIEVSYIMLIVLDKHLTENSLCVWVNISDNDIYYVKTSDRIGVAGVYLSVDNVLNKIKRVV